MKHFNSLDKLSTGESNADEWDLALRNSPQNVAERDKIRNEKLHGGHLEGLQ